MPRISKHFKLPFTTVNIKYGKEKISFSLLRELRIDEDKINEEMSTQPGMYGFCLLLHKKLLTEFEKAKLQRNRVYGHLLFQAKEKKSKSTGRYYTDDMAKAWVEKHDEYVEASLVCIKIKDSADTIYSCIKSFEQRKDLIQSISSNLRNER